MSTAGPGARRTAAVVALAASLLVPAATTQAGSPELISARLCRKSFTVQGRTYALKRMALLQQCADRLLACELGLELDGVSPAACRVAATDGCAKRLGSEPDSALSKAALRFDGKTGALCETPVFSYADVLSTGAGGLWFGNDTGCASSIDLPSFLACLRDEVDARTDALVSSAKPRTALLLDDVGLGAGFPHLVRPPLVTQIVAATSAGSGVLVGPGTLGVPVGTALRFTGDDATLSCSGSSTNGRLTITVGTGQTAQRRQLQEPWGADVVATFGPWVAPASVPYMIDYQDGSCHDVVTGTVSVS